MQNISSTSVDVSVLVDAVQTECSRSPDRLTDGNEAAGGGGAKDTFQGQEQKHWRHAGDVQNDTSLITID